MFKDIVEFINSYVEQCPQNSVSDINLERIYDAPLIGIASVEDPLFLLLKKAEVVGEWHLSPEEWLPGAKSVISYFLPFNNRINEANQQNGWPAKEWLYGRVKGEAFNNSLRQFIVDKLNDLGINAISPVIESKYNIIDVTSNWSERHVAFIAGLGTFSLSKSLITQKGCAGRYGSVIVDTFIEPTPRSYEDIYEYCNMCGDCIDRCPAKAINEEGKDKNKCAHYIRTYIKPKYAPLFGCGKCQTAVSCQSRIP